MSPITTRAPRMRGYIPDQSFPNSPELDPHTSNSGDASLHPRREAIHWRKGSGHSCRSVVSGQWFSSSIYYHRMAMSTSCFLPFYSCLNWRSRTSKALTREGYWTYNLLYQCFFDTERPQDELGCLDGNGKWA